MQRYGVLKEQLLQLNLDAVAEHFLAKATESRKQGLDYEEYLAQLIAMQLERKRQRSINYRLRIARFPEIKTIEGFNFDFQPSIDRQKLFSLLDFEFIKRAENILFLGPPGVGKTHLAIALGIKACEQRIRTHFITAQQLLENLKMAQLSGTFPETLDRYSRFELLIIDELGYLPMKAEDAKIFFKLVSMKYEKTSIIITTNQPFKQWGEVFQDEVIATAILDRLLHHAVIFKIQGKSYRMKDKMIEENK